MSSTLMIRVGGVAAVLAGSLRILSDSYELVFGRVTPGSTGDTVTAAAHATHLPLLVFAIIGVHLLQQRTVDAFGQLCTLVAIFGMMFLFGGAWAQSFLLPAQRAEGSAVVDDPGPLAIAGFLAATVLFVLGLLLWGVTILRARVLPAWPAVLLLVGLLGGALLKPVVDGALLPLNAAIVCIGVVTLIQLSRAKADPSDVAVAAV
jgi:hypothetical protein